MPIKPGPVYATIGGINVLVDNITETYDTELFDRVEFDHDKLKSAPLSTGTVPTIVSLLGGKPAEIVIDCALSGMVGGASSYVPRPLTPNSTADWNNIKKRFNIRRFQISGGQSPESASPAASVDGIRTLRVLSRTMLTQFQNRLATYSGNVPYETLIAAQGDDIMTLYFTTGISVTLPGPISLTNALITDFQVTHEFVIPQEDGSTSIYKGFSATVEYRTLTNASAA